MTLHTPAQTSSRANNNHTDTNLLFFFSFFFKCITDCHQRDKCDTANWSRRSPPPPSSHHQPLELPFYPLSESHIRTHLLPYPVRCCWAEPTGPCLSLLWLLPLLLLLLPPQSSVRGQLANGTGFRKGERERRRGRKKIDKLAGEARRPLFIVQSK